MNKQKVLKSLGEESSTVYSAVLLIRNLYLLYMGAMVLAMIAGIAFSSKFAAVLQAGNDTSFLSSLLHSMTFEHPLKSDGSFNLLIYLAGCVIHIAASAVYAFIFHTILQVFKEMKEGLTPFTLKNAYYWKQLYKIFAVLAVISFLASFIFNFAALTFMLSSLVYACFFLSMSLVFEYGSQLQQESDETL